MLSHALTCCEFCAAHWCSVPGSPVSAGAPVSAGGERCRAPHHVAGDHAEHCHLDPSAGMALAHLGTSQRRIHWTLLNIVERRYWKSLKCLEMIHINIFKQLRWLIQTMDCLLPSSSICLGVICATTMSNIVTLRLFSCFFVTTFAILGCSCCMLLLARGSFLSKTSQPPKCRALSTVWQRGSSNDSNSSCIYCQATAKLLPVQAKLLVIVNMHTKNKDGGNWGPVSPLSQPTSNAQPPHRRWCWKCNLHSLLRSREISRVGRRNTHWCSRVLKRSYKAQGFQYVSMSPLDWVQDVSNMFR